MQSAYLPSPNVGASGLFGVYVLGLGFFLKGLGLGFGVLAWQPKAIPLNRTG